jgi:hypothetical protein
MALDAISDFQITKSEDVRQLQDSVKSLIKQGFVPWAFGTESIGQPEYWCALVKGSNIKAVVTAEVPKIEAALNLLKTDSTAGSIGAQIAALNTAVNDIKALAIGNADLDLKITAITNAVTQITSIANTQRTALNASKDAIKNAP